MIIPVLEEVTVVHKQLRLKEEVRITPKRTQDVEHHDVLLRREEVTTSRFAPAASPASAGEIPPAVSAISAVFESAATASPAAPNPTSATSSTT